jgi:hypothetical protein
MEQQKIDLNNENVEQRKRGRKTSKQSNYFDIREENAVRMFLLISSIIRRYKLYRKDMTFEEIHTDTHSFLMTKIDKFKPSKEKKAYSYFGTICKNYLMGQIIKDQKEFNRKISYEDISSSLEERLEFSYLIDEEIIDADSVIVKFKDELKSFIKKENLSDNEKKLGLALLDIFDNYDNIFMGTENNKFNKNVILLSLREMTNLTTKEIRNSMKKYKKLYSGVMNIILK